MRYRLLLLIYLISLPLAAQIREIDYLQAPDSSKFSIQFLDLDIASYNSSFAPNEVIMETDNEIVVNFNNVLTKLDDENTALGNIDAQTLEISYEHSQFSFHLGHKLKYIGGLEYSGDLAIIATLGNGDYLGQSINIGPAFLYNHYHALYLGGSVRSGNFQLGGRIQFLTGNEYAGTDRHQMVLTTAEQAFDLTIEGNYDFYSSALLQYRGLNNVETDFDLDVYNSFFKDNQGLAVDLGIRWDLSEELSIYASIQDYGSISWDKRTDYYSKNETTTYEGVDLLNFFSDGDEINITDSLYALLDFENEQDLEFSQKIPWNLIFGALYHLSPDSRIEFSLGRQNIRFTTLQTWFLEYHHTFNKQLSLYGNVNGYDDTALNVGVGTALNLGPVYIRAGTSNIAGIFNLLSTRYNRVYFGMGLNIK